ncbi:MAG TPA: hypothetical protein VE973_02540 [Candidatus Limnocylindria bacterium]|nr:hypothetical protein [Candidatus Limnocylindria bacterium]
MPDEIRINRSAPTMGQSQGGMRQEMQQEQMPQPKSKMPWVVLVLVVVVIIVLGVLFRGQLFKGSSSTNSTKSDAMSKASGYQAVFLTNGQVYFGKISATDSDYVTLDDIYYLQVGPAQGSATAPAAAGQPAPAAPQQSISLVKLGNELHGPVDEMHISRTQVLFYEDLKSDGNVVTAILKDKADKAATPAAPAK